MPAPLLQCGAADKLMLMEPPRPAAAASSSKYCGTCGAVKHMGRAWVFDYCRVLNVTPCFLLKEFPRHMHAPPEHLTLLTHSHRLIKLLGPGSFWTRDRPLPTCVDLPQPVAPDMTTTSRTLCFTCHLLSWAHHTTLNPPPAYLCRFAAACCSRYHHHVAASNSRQHLSAAAIGRQAGTAGQHRCVTRVNLHTLGAEGGGHWNGGRECAALSVCVQHSSSMCLLFPVLDTANFPTSC
jgi:hypothetical protein